MSHRLTRGLGVALAVSALCSLTACATDEASVPSSSASDSAASIVAPIPPAAMSDSGEAGAVAAAEYFLRLSLYGAATGDWSEYDAMSGDTCEFCKSYHASNQQNLDKEAVVGIPEMRVVDSAVYPWEEDATMTRVDLLVERDATVLTYADGTQEPLSFETSMMAFLLDGASSWRVVGVQVHEAQKFNELYGE